MAKDKPRRNRRRTANVVVTWGCLLWGAYTGVTGYLTDDVMATVVDWTSSGITLSAAGLLFSQRKAYPLLAKTKL